MKYFQQVNIKPHMIIILTAALSWGQICMGQETVLKGRIRHSNTYTEIPDANIYIMNSTIGTTSDLKGYFELHIPRINENMIVIIEHIAFDTLTLPLTDALKKENFYLVPRLIQLPAVTVESSGERPDFLKDLPQPHTVIDSRSYEMQGYIDAGDLLRAEQSVAVEEDLSGKKTISVRGGNPDDVIVLYNGIRMNNLYDNIFDLSLINLDEIKQIELIKGSNTSLYGSEAFSGVINIVPRIHRNYKIRFMQRLGTYAAGDWNLQLNQNFYDRLNVSYGYKKGAYQRRYADDSTLKNSAENHTATVYYDLGEEDKQEQSGIGLLFLHSDLDYSNARYQESLNNRHNLFSLRYSGPVWISGKWTATASYQQYNNEEQIMAPSGKFNKHFFNDANTLDIEKAIVFKPLELLVGYQYENNKLDFKEVRNNPDEINLGLESANFIRNKHGIVTIVKLHAPSGSDFLNTSDVNFSYRYDNVRDEANNIISRETRDATNSDLFPENNWRESTFKVSTELAGKNKNFAFDGYMNYGSNIKFPSIYQQLSVPSTILQEEQLLKPEKNNGLEIGVNITKEYRDRKTISGWLLETNYFRNYFENKFRMYYRPGIPIAFYDNVPAANIFGLDIKGTLYLMQKKVSITIGSSQYDIQEKSAFPFKYESKSVLNLSVDHAGYSFKFNGFIEGPQSGWIRDIDGRFRSISLSGYTNFDLHLGKNFELFQLKLFSNISLRNVLNDNTELEGLAIRDRRIYITFGVNY